LNKQYWAQPARNWSVTVVLSVRVVLYFCNECNFNQDSFTGYYAGAMVTAILLTPAAAAGVFFAPLGGRASDRYGPGPPIVIGMILRAASFVMLSQISLTTPYLHIAAALALSGIGFGLTSAPALNAVIAGNGHGHYGIASGMQNMIRFTGASIGTAIGGIMLYAFVPAAFSGITGAIPGFREVFLDVRRCMYTRRRRRGMAVGKSGPERPLIVKRIRLHILI